MVIEPELLHLNDEIEVLCDELNVVSLQNDIENVRDNFLRIANDIRERFDRLVMMMIDMNSFRSRYLFSHKSATIIANDIKRNFAILEDTLGQCSIESRTRYEGDVAELKAQLERMMVKKQDFPLQFSLIDLYRMWKNDWIISLMCIQTHCPY